MDKVILKTQRTRLQETNLNDAAFYLELLNSPSWLHFIGDRKVHSLEDAENYIKNKIRPGYAEHGFGMYTVYLEEENIPVGVCGVMKREELEQADIGFAMLPAFEGQGIITETALAIREYARNQLGIHTLWGITTHDNFASMRVMEKLGMKLIGNTRLDGDSEELLLFST
ncbi:MAG: GNAT family N-acetyltransferase [Bacteroidia bacterium]|nr:GNAT family N-acetyltransferase [Bacteroidia bacterium]